MIFQNQTMKIRIDNIGTKKPAYIGKPPADAHRRLDIVRYYPCEYYGKLDEYIADGWETVEEGTHLKKDRCTISKSFFDREELCYTIAYIIYDPREVCTDLKSVGERLLSLSKKDRADFFEVYEIAAAKLREACSEEED